MDSLEEPKIDSLLARLDELVRWRPGAKGRYTDLHGAIGRLQGSANHIILGRRGSGKTRLIDELKRAVTGGATHVVTVGAEDFKQLTYPDILIQILRAFLKEFSGILERRPKAFSRQWRSRLFHCVVSPLDSYARRQDHRRLLEEVRQLRQGLDALLAESDELDAEYALSSSSSSRHTAAVELGTPTGGVSAVKAGLSRETQGATSSERRRRQREAKREKVERLLGDFKALLDGVCRHTDKRVILAVDDFYFIQRTDQPKVIDYVHRICKDTNAFLKVATIKHRSQLSSHEDVSQGVVLGHEIQAINLELPLGHFDSISKFLRSIWGVVCSEVQVDDADGVFIGDGFHQAVLASGGVPRDFFGVVKAAIVIARERSERGVGKRRVNEAARQYADDTKYPELSLDVGQTGELALLLLYDIVRFARDTKRRNCFHINIDELQKDQDMQNVVDALVDSRFLHLITDNTSNARRAGRYAAYLLDVGLYGYPEMRGPKAVEETEFWARDDGGHLKNLRQCPVYPLRSATDLQNGAAALGGQGMDVKQALLGQDAETPLATPVAGGAVQFAMDELFPPLPEPGADGPPL